MSGLSFLLVAVVVTTSTCLVAVQGSLTPEPKRCCVPKQYSAIMTEMGSLNAHTDNFTSLEMQMDFVQKKMVVVNYTWPIPSDNRIKWNSKILIDFNKEKLYVIIPKPDLCFNYSYTERLERCIPDSAQYITTTYLGPEGVGMLTFDVWRVTAHLTHRTAPAAAPVTTIAITRDTCVPLMEGIHVPGSKMADKMYMFSNFQAKLTDPSAFDLPASCKK